MRVLSLNYEFPPIGGGGGNAHQHLLREFTRFPDLEVSFLSITNQPKPVHERYSDHVQLILLPLKKKDLLYWRRMEIVQYLAMHYGFLGEYLKTNSFDLCHVFFGFPSGYLAYLHREEFPYLVSVRGSDVPGFNHRFSLDYWLLRPFLKRIYRSAKAVVANSAGFKNLFERQFPNLSASVIPNGIDTLTYYPRLHEKNDPPTLVTVARLIPRKGIDRLIQACAILKKEGLAFHCHIIGDGPEENTLKTMARKLEVEDRIEFRGRLEKDQIAAFLSLCDIFVLPSFAEGMSNAALEAMASGLPLLLTDTGGSRELIDGNGAIVPVGDEAALTTTLREWLQQPERRISMGKRSRVCANAFSWRNVAQRYHELYHRILEENRHP